MALTYNKFFNNHAAYNSYQTILDSSVGEALKDNISLCDSDEHLHYNPVLAAKMTSLEPNDNTVIGVSARWLENGKLSQKELDKAGITSYTNTLAEYQVDPTLCKKAKIEVYDYVSSLQGMVGWFEVMGTFSLLPTIIECILPDTVTVIPNQIFWGCEEMKKVTLGNSVTSIEHGAFDECYGLETLICNTVTPPTLAGPLGTLPAGTDYKIYVPDEAVNAYKSAQNWSTIANKIYSINDLPE